MIEFLQYLTTMIDNNWIILYLCIFITCFIIALLTYLITASYFIGYVVGSSIFISLLITSPLVWGAWYPIWIAFTNGFTLTLFGIYLAWNRNKCGTH